MNFDYLKKCLKESAKYFHIPEEDILKSTREDTIVTARRVAIFLARRSGIKPPALQRYLDELGWSTTSTNIYYSIDYVQRKYQRKDPLILEAIETIRPNARRKE